MKNLSDKVLEKIKQESIKPHPRWYFLARDCFLWFLVSLVTVLGGIAFSLVMLFLYFQRFGFRNPHPASNFNWLLVSIPYAWLFVFVVLVVVIYYNLKHLKKSYKYPPYLLIIASLVASIVFGVIISNFGVHRRMNDEFSRRVPFYGRVFDARVPAWGRPMEGVLAGKIGRVEEDFFLLEDFHAKEWKIVLLKETEAVESIKIVSGQLILINGRQEGPGVFVAEEIFPWEGCPKKCKLINSNFPRIR